MNAPYPFLGTAVEPRPQRVRDLTWDRIVFHPPALPNPRALFDPLPFRTQPVPRPVRVRPATAG